MQYNEEKMIQICKELGIEIVDRDSNPIFFEEEKKVRLSDIFNEPIMIEADEVKCNSREFYQQVVLENYCVEKNEKDLSEQMNGVNVSGKVVLHNNFYNKNDSEMYKAVFDSISYKIA